MKKYITKKNFVLLAGIFFVILSLAVTTIILINNKDNTFTTSSKAAVNSTFSAILTATNSINCTTGQTVKLNANVASTNQLKSAELWITNSKATRPTWCTDQINDPHYCRVSTSVSGVISYDFKAPDNDVYTALLNAYDITGKNCTGNPFDTIPSDWSKCSNNNTDYIQFGYSNSVPKCLLQTTPTSTPTAPTNTPAPSAPVITPTLPPTSRNYTCNMTAPSGSASTAMNNCIQECKNRPSMNCTINLADGIYNVTESIILPNNTTLTSASKVKEKVVINRASYTMGSIISLASVTNVTVQYVDLNGQKLAPQSNLPFNNPNIYATDCTNCKISSIISENARLSSIAVASGENIIVENNYVHDNGTPEDVSGKPFMRSDGITIQAIKGTSRVSGNVLKNNTDINLIIGGGTTGSLTISDNIVQPHTLSKINNQPISGGAFMFDTEPNWSPNCRAPLTADCNDFSAVKFLRNTDTCGVSCVYGTAVGTHLNKNWSAGLGLISGPVKNLVISPNDGNKLDRMTIDYAGTGTIVNPSVNKCRYSTLSIPGTYNGSICLPCKGTGEGGDGTSKMCDYVNDN